MQCFIALFHSKMVPILLMSDDTLGINYVTLFILVGFISFNYPKEEYLSFINILQIKYNKDYIHSHTYSLTDTPVQMFKHFLII